MHPTNPHTQNHSQSYLRFHHPEAQPGQSTAPHLLSIAAAADAFGGQGTYSSLLAHLGAFFVHRNRAPHTPPDPALDATVRALLAAADARGEPLVLEAFLEGTRSRDRRTKRPPRTGLLRCVLAAAAAEGRAVVVLPVAVSYEGLPEQGAMAAEIRGEFPGGGGGGSDSIGPSLLRWAGAVLRGRVRLGAAWVKAGEPITYLPPTADFPSTPTTTTVSIKDTAARLARAAQRAQRRAVVLTARGHVAAAVVDVPGVEPAGLRRACRALGMEVVEGGEGEKGYVLPVDATERWMLHLQWAGAFGGLVARAGLPAWGAWLAGGDDGACDTDAAAEADEGTEAACAPLTAALVAYLGRLTAEVEAAVLGLRARGVMSPSPSHVAQQLGTPVPLQLVAAAVGILRGAGVAGGQESKGPSGPVTVAGGREDEEAAGTTAAASAAVDERCAFWDVDGEEDGATAAAAAAADPDAEAFGAWGFRDSRFVVLLSPSASASCTKPVVMLTGRRYPLSGRPLPGLLPFFSQQLGVPLSAHDAQPPQPRTPQIPPLALTPQSLARLRAACPALSIDPTDRARHGTGHALEDMVALRLRLGKPQQQASPLWRMPDAVCRPASEAEVAALVRVAAPASEGGVGLCLVPYGGGSNVSLMLRAPTLEEEPRPIVSVDLRDLNRVLWVDEEHGVAEIEAGANGREIQGALAGMGAGWTLGHEPDSFEFSTLGGWVATKASGMKRGRYGNIEDIVLGVSFRCMYRSLRKRM